MKLSVVATLSVVAWLVNAVPASADLIFFSEDRAMSVAGYRYEGAAIVLSLRGGGEMVFDRTLVLRIAPDEVPYPEPQPEALVTAASPEIPAVSPLTGSGKYDALIEEASARHGVDARVVKAVIQVESAYEPKARSPKGAKGLMQLMPRTARQYGLHNPYDPVANIDAGTRHLGALLREFELPAALAAYNAGGFAVRRFSGIPPYPETRAYVARVLSLLGGSLAHR